MNKNFAVFILTHGRPDNIPTIRALRKNGYTGDIYILLDDEDETYDKYVENYGENNVIVFNKQKIFDNIDKMDLTGEKRSIVFARNAVYEEAAKLGLDFFLTLEDDYVRVGVNRYVKNGKFLERQIYPLDSLFEAMIDFLVESNADTVCFSQNGDFIGGANNQRLKEKLLRKAMNAFFCRTDRPIKFFGTINEDVNTYTTLGSRGHLLFTTTDATIQQKASQSLAGGMTELYTDNGTYLKSFYSVMAMPSCVKVSVLMSGRNRIHHRVYWNNCVPKILNEKWRKH